MSLRTSIKLTNSVTASVKPIPTIGLGTWLSKPGEVANAVEIAVRNGYRHLDLAYIYQNQDEVGSALKKVIPSVVKREELFITSKLWCNAFDPYWKNPETGKIENLVAQQLDKSLEQTGLDYFDLYLIHWPIAFAPGDALFPPDTEREGWVKLDRKTTLAATWLALNALLHTGKVRAVGVSNFSVSVLEELYKATGILPAVNQIEAHPLLPQEELYQYCKAHNIHLTAYSPLGNNLKGEKKLTDYDEVIAIADKLKITTAQVLIAWGVQRGYSVIPKSVQEERIISNFQQVTLSDDDIAALNELVKTKPTRFNIPFHYTPRWDINIFGFEGASNDPLVASLN